MAINPKSSGARSLARMMALTLLEKRVQMVAEVAHSAPLLTFFDKDFPEI